MFQRVLIANRGEIAVRIIRACRELEIETVAVYSAADRDALHVQLATRAVCIGPARAADSYLNQAAILTAAVETGCDAVHPGYGFLSENPDFADLCAECGLNFIGPSGDVIRQMGSKAAARALMQQLRRAGGPRLRRGAVDLEEARRAGRRGGLPRAGEGLCRRRRPGDAPGGPAGGAAGPVPGRPGEAVACFGNGEMYLEKLILNPRHIEFQILADSPGQCDPSGGAGLLHPAAEPEADRGVPLQGPHPPAAGGDGRRPPWPPPRPPATRTPAPSSSCWIRTGSSTSSR